MTKGAGKTHSGWLCNVCRRRQQAAYRSAHERAKTLEGGTRLIQAIALVLDFAPAHWSPSTRMVAVALGDYVNTDSSYAWPSVANLARRSGLSTRQVQRCLRQIEKDGWIERQPDTHRLGTTLWIWRKRIGLGVTPTSPPR
jgi:predicted Rossmann fold nucleotide-binding protein DprA/Smf involved in DNA uptake